MSTALGLRLQHIGQVPSLTDVLASDCDVGFHSLLCLSVVKAMESTWPAFLSTSVFQSCENAS
jgi:hypothetical protein